MKNSAFNHAIGVLPRWLRQTLLVMRITTLILLAALLQVSASSLAQKISIDKKNASIQTILNEISKQSGYDFFYDANALKKIKPISVSIKNTDLNDAIKTSLQGLPLSYSIDNKTVVIKEAAPSLLDRLFRDDDGKFADIRGVVRNERGEALEGITVMVKGAKTGTKTNANGEFVLKGVKKGDVLVFTGVAIEPFEYIVKDDKNIDLNLKARLVQLEEVNVEYNTGYQSIPKERATGSFAYVDNETINRSVSTNILDRLKGVTSGLNYEPIKPGNPSNLSIRGISTINSNMQPLIVVDGFPYDETENFNNVVNNLNPSDVENITILKDAAAASIWGVRAGNGVIVITTKKGKYNQTSRVQLNSNVTIGEKPNVFYRPILSSSEYIDLEKALFSQGVYNGKLSDAFSFPAVSQGVEILQKLKVGQINQIQADQQLNALKDDDFRKDFSEHLLQSSVNQQYALNMSGGGTLYKYFSSVGFDRNRSNNVKNDQSRLSIRFDNTYKIVKNLEVSGFITHTQSQQNSISNSLNDLITNPRVTPYTTMIDSEGKAASIPYDYRTAYIDTAKYPALLDWHYRPLEELSLNKFNSKTYDSRIGAGLKYNILRGLDIDIKYQYQLSHITNDNYMDAQSYNVRNLVNQYMSVNRVDKSIKYNIPNSAITYENNKILKQWNFRGQINFNQSWRMHDISAIAGAEVRELKSKGSAQRYYGFDPLNGTFKTLVNYDSLYTLRPSSNIERIPNLDSFNATTNRYLSYFSNGAYTYNNRYIFSASARIDGSNFFGINANQRVVPLWSVGLAWNLSNESFFKFTSLPYVKIRATYGYSGNTNNSATAYTIITYAGSQAPLSRLTYANVSNAPNPELRWERVKIVNLGLDFAIKNDALTGSVDLYSKQGIDLIGPIKIDPTTGIGGLAYFGNSSNIKGKGIDIVINSRNTNGLIKWTSNLLFNFNSEKLTSYVNPSITAAAIVGDGGKIIGKPINSIYSYRWAGLNSKTGDPQVYLADSISSFVNLSKATIDDVIYHGSTKPNFFGSLRNTIAWKDLSISFNVIYKFKYYFRRSSVRYTDLLSANSWNGHNDYSKRWLKSGDEMVTDVPSLPSSIIAGRDESYLNSDIMIEKGDHIRLQDLRVDYEFNKHRNKWLPVQSVRFFLYANNLGIIWRVNKKDIDPDYGDNMNGFLPASRTISVGLNMNF